MKFENGIEITNLQNVQRMPDGSFLLNVDLVTSSDPLETVQYCARDNDVAETGQWVYQQVIEGNFEGEITDWVPPPPPPVEGIGNQIPGVRDQLLRYVVDPVVSNPLRWNDMTETQQQAWADYRRALLDLPSNPSFPWYNTVVTTDPVWGARVDINSFPWPTKPLQ